MHSFPSPVGVLIFYVCNYLGLFYNVQYIVVYVVWWPCWWGKVYWVSFSFILNITVGEWERSSPAVRIPPQRDLAPPLTLCIPQSHENWRSHVLMSNKCLLIKSGSLPLGFSYFTWLSCLFFLFLLVYEFIKGQNLFFTKICYFYLYSLPILFFTTVRCFYLNALPRTLAVLGNLKTLCPLVFNFANIHVISLCLIFTCTEQYSPGRNSFWFCANDFFFPLNFFFWPLSLNNCLVI